VINTKSVPSKSKKTISVAVAMLLLLIVIPLRAEETTDLHIRHMLESIRKGAPSGICVVENRVIAQVNDYILNLTGYSREELLGKSIRMLFASQ